MPDLEDLSFEQQHALRSAATNLQREFDGIFGTETIEQFLATSYDQFAVERQDRHLPAPLRRALRAATSEGARQGRGQGRRRPPRRAVPLRAQRRAVADGARLVQPPRGDRAIAWSGGSEPGKEVNPSAVLAMAEVGIDIAAEFPKPWTDEIVRAADVVVTMGCGDACPLFPGKRYEDWELEDPAGQDLDAVRPIRDEIGRRVARSPRVARRPDAAASRRRAAGRRVEQAGVERSAGRGRQARRRRRVNDPSSRQHGATAGRTACRRGSAGTDSGSTAQVDGAHSWVAPPRTADRAWWRCPDTTSETRWARIRQDSRRRERGGT